jgi:uroporphyrinogen decarboxylase
MNSLERCLKVINNEIPDRVPVIPQDSHIAAHLAGLDHMEYAHDASKRADAVIAQRERFDFDGCIVGGDTVCLAEAVGVNIEYTKDECPRFKSGCLNDYETVADLKLPDPKKDGRMPVWCETIERVAASIGSEYLIIARADQGAFSLASMMRGMEEFMMDLAMAKFDEELQAKIHSLLKYCNDAQFEFIKALKEAGAHVVTTGDSISGPSVCAPATYEEYSWPYEKQMVEKCDALGVPYSIHICGHTDPILEKWAQAGMHLMEIDHKTDFITAREVTRGKTTIIGNIDTSDVMFSGTPDMVKAACKEIIDICRPDCGLILSSGCMLSGITPTENLQALADAGREFGQY